MHSCETIQHLGIILHHHQIQIYMAESTPGVRLNKYISDTGHCSRREADKLIEEGRVEINGQPTGLGMRVNEGDVVTVNGKHIGEKKASLYIALNKPVGIICTTEVHIPGNIIPFIKHKERIFPIGRLDKPSEGLILLTNDGNIINKILRAGNQHEKEYIVSVHKPITDDFIQKMGNGVKILDTVTKKCKIYKEGKNVFRIILVQGLNRQIRRMCEALGYEVLTLKRIRIMNITLEGLPIGQWRNLTSIEVDDILRMVATSSKTAEASSIEDKADDE